MAACSPSSGSVSGASSRSGARYRSATRKIPNPKSQTPNPKTESRGIGIGVWNLGLGIWIYLLLPGDSQRLAEQVVRIDALTRMELLRAALVDLGDVEVAFRVRAEVVHAPEAAREVAPRAPRIEEVAVEIVLEHLARAAIECPDGAVNVVDQMHVGRSLAERPLVEELSVLVEHLDTVVAAVVDVDAQCLRIHGNAVHVVEVGGARVVVV